MPGQKPQDRTPVIIAGLFVLGAAVISGVFLLVSTALSTSKGRPSPIETGAPTPTQAPGSTTSTVQSGFRGIVLRDDFSRASGWTQQDGTVSAVGYVDGEYSVHLKKGNYGTYGIAPLTGLGPNVRIEVDARKVGDAAATFGLFCRGGSGSLPYPEYSGRIDTSGEWTIWKFEPEGGQPKILAGATDSAGAIIRNGTNHISLECTGSDSENMPVRIVLYANGKRIGEATDAKGPRPGRVGVHVISSPATPDIEVRFDNIIVTAL